MDSENGVAMPETDLCVKLLRTILDLQERCNGNTEFLEILLFLSVDILHYMVHLAKTIQ